MPLIIRMPQNQPMRPNMSSYRAWLLPLLCLGAVLTLAFCVPDAWSQDDPVAAEAASTEEASQPTSLMDMIIGGGIFMIPIGLLSLWMITLSVFLGLQLSRKKFIPSRLKEEILSLMSEVRVRSTIDAASQDPSFLGRLATAAYVNVDATDTETLGRSKVEEGMADFAAKESLNMTVLIGYLSVIAQSATMLGLFGTVAGMVMAFDTMGLSGGSDAGALAGNISLALITTAGGLVVAIPALLIYYTYKNRYLKLINETQQVVLEGLDAAVATVNADQALAKVPEGIAEI